MERTDIPDLMGSLKLYGMRAAEACPRAGEARPGGRGDEPCREAPARAAPRVVGDLLKAEIA